MRVWFGILILASCIVQGFVPQLARTFLPRWQRLSPTTLSSAEQDESIKPRTAKGPRKPSKVSDPDGPTPPEPPIEWEEFDTDKLPVQDYNESLHPIPHQPWRRGLTYGCEDPIHVPWRMEAEEIIKDAANEVGATVLDVTWYLGSCLITLDDAIHLVANPDKFDKAAVMIQDRADPNYKWGEGKDTILDDDWEDEVLSIRDDTYKIEAINNRLMPAEDEEVIGPLEKQMKFEADMIRMNPFPNETTRGDVEQDLSYIEDEDGAWESMPRSQEFDWTDRKYDTNRLGAIGGRILDALDRQEDRLDILGRHEIILTYPTPPYVLETQRQFDKHRGYEVWVRTIDPFGSNRVIKGKLLERNSMDVYLSKEGRVVTIPHNFIKAVMLDPKYIQAIGDTGEWDQEEARDDRGIFFKKEIDEELESKGRLERIVDNMKQEEIVRTLKQDPLLLAEATAADGKRLWDAHQKTIENIKKNQGENETKKVPFVDPDSEEFAAAKAEVERNLISGDSNFDDDFQLEEEGYDDE